MGDLEYHRPRTLEEALELLGRGIPLAGGTRLTPRLGDVAAVVDLQELDLDWVQVREGTVAFGAMVSLQEMIEVEPPLPPALLDCCRREAGLNLRNAATLGGTIAVGDGRSPLLTSLLAIDARLTLQPGARHLSLDQYLDARSAEGEASLITEIVIPASKALAYEQVARSPADRPLVSAAVAVLEISGGRQIRAVLGGYGARPVLVGQQEAGVPAEGVRPALAEAGAAAYALAEDEWASAEFRARVAERLLARLIGEVLSA